MPRNLRRRILTKPKATEKPGELYNKTVAEKPVATTTPKRKVVRRVPPRARAAKRRAETIKKTFGQVKSAIKGYINN